MEPGSLDPVSYRALLDMTLFKHVAGALGVSVAAIRVFITILAAYPLTTVYKWQFYNSSARTKHLFFASCGIGLVIFNYGWDVGHSFFSVVVCWVLIKCLGGTLLSVVLAFSIFMTHLLIGYKISERAIHEFTWTLPHCILTQRLIGLVWDVYDGNRPNRKSLSESQRKSAVYDPPSLLELLGYSYFFTSFLCGPQYPINRYRQFVANAIGSDVKGRPLNSSRAASSRFCLGLFVLATHAAVSTLVNNKLLLSPQFLTYSFTHRLVILAVWGRLVMARYQGVWLVVEGSCIFSGLAHNGFHKPTGGPLFDGLKNVHMRKFETATKFQHIIQSYNRMTNLWVADYVYKRMKFLGSKTWSHIVVLVFLAFWHGTYSGYFVTFSWEFICIATEQSCERALARLPRLQETLNQRWVFPIVWIVLKIWVLVHLGFGYLPFALLTHEKWNLVYERLYYFGFVNIVMSYLISRLVLNFVPPEKLDLKFETESGVMNGSAGLKKES